MDKKISSGQLRGAAAAYAGWGLLTRNTVLNLLGQVVPLGIAIVTVPYLIRGLGAGRYGILSLSLVVMGYFSIFDFGLGRATVKFVAEAHGKGDHGSIPAIIWTSLLVQCIMGIIGGVMLLCVTPLLVTRVFNIPPDLIVETRDTFYLLSAAIPVVICSLTMRGVLEAAQRFDMINAVKIPSSIMIYTIPVIAVYFGARLPFIMSLVLFIWIITFIVYAALCVRLHPALGGPERFFDKKMFRALFTFGGWVFVCNITIPFLLTFDKIVIGATRSVQELGYYSAAYDVVSRLQIIPLSFVMTFFPALTAASSDNAAFRHIYTRSARIMFLVMAVIVAGILVFANPVLRIWFGESLGHRISPVFMILSIGIFFNALAQIPANALDSMGRPDLRAKVFLSYLFFYIAFLYFMITNYGIAGAAVSWSIRAMIEMALFFGMVRLVMKRNGVFEGMGRPGGNMRLKQALANIWFIKSRIPCFDIPIPLRAPYGAWYFAYGDVSGFGLLRLCFLGKESNAGIMRFLEKHIKPGMVFFDVGANQGLYTVFVSKKIRKEGRVHAFEPSPRESNRLRRNLFLNRCSNVIVNKCAVGDIVGDVSFYACLGHQGSLSSMKPQAGDVSARRVQITVPVTTLDEYVRTQGVSSIDIIKVDVEGAELSVFKGGGSVFRSASRPVVICEVENIRTRQWGYDAREILDLLAGAGYSWYSANDEGELIPYSSGRESIECNLIAIPEEKSAMVSEMAGSVNNLPLITVVTVVFNGVKNVEMTIKSVLDQTYRNVEYIIIDGGSTDGTIEVINKYQDRISLLVSEPDNGLYDAMNKAIRLAKGEWINFMNVGDAFYSPTTLEEIFQGRNHDAELLYGDHEVVYGSGLSSIRRAGRWDDLWKGMVFCHQSLFTRSTVFKKLMFNDKRRETGDFEFIYTAFINGCTHKHVDIVIAKYLAQGPSDVYRARQILFAWSVVRRSRNTLSVNAYYAALLARTYVTDILKKVMPPKINRALLALKISVNKRSAA